MSRILCVWELGADLGHIGPLAQLGVYLKTQGHEVVFALRDVSFAEKFLGPHDFKWFAAPMWQGGHAAGPTVPINYSDILLGSGYHNETSLLSLVKAWRSLYEAIAPDLIIFDFAPTALLAARGLGVPRVIVGTGFHTPPDKSPWPNFRVDIPVAPDRFIDNAGVVLETINRVLIKLNQPVLGAIHQLFDAEENFLCVFPELDHYSGRSNANYCGPIFNHTMGVSPGWDSNTKKKIFIYAKSRYPQLATLIHQLSVMPHETLVYAPELPRPFIDRYQNTNVRFSDEPVRIEDVVGNCDLGICHGGTLTSAFLLAGKPLLLLPMHAEQMLTARLVEKIGAGKAVFLTPTMDFSSTIQSLLTQSHWRENAQGFAKKYPNYTVTETLRTIASRCATAMANGN